MTSIGDRISKKKGKNKKTKYIGQIDWDFLMEYWDTPPAQKKSKSAASSRMSDPLNKGIHKHCAGPVSFVRIEYNMVSDFLLIFLHYFIYSLLFWTNIPLSFCRWLSLVWMNHLPSQIL